MKFFDFPCYSYIFGCSQLAHFPFPLTFLSIIYHELYFLGSSSNVLLYTLASDSNPPEFMLLVEMKRLKHPSVSFSHDQVFDAF